MWRAGRISAEVHAQLHGVVAPASIPSLRERAEGLRGGTERVPAHIAEWALRQFEKMPNGDRLLHGDFHPGNILMPPSGPMVSSACPLPRRRHRLAERDVRQP